MKNKIVLLKILNIIFSLMLVVSMITLIVHSIMYPIVYNVQATYSDLSFGTLTNSVNSKSIYQFKLTIKNVSDGKNHRLSFQCEVEDGEDIIVDFVLQSHELSEKENVVWQYYETDKEIESVEAVYLDSKEIKQENSSRAVIDISLDITAMVLLIIVASVVKSKLRKEKELIEDMEYQQRQLDDERQRQEELERMREENPLLSAIELEKIELEKKKIELEQERLKQLIEEKKDKTVVCEYCGSTNPIKNTRCVGCGAKLK